MDNSRFGSFQEVRKISNWIDPYSSPIPAPARGSQKEAYAAFLHFCSKWITPIGPWPFRTWEYRDWSLLRMSPILLCSQGYDFPYTHTSVDLLRTEHFWVNQSSQQSAQALQPIRLMHACFHRAHCVQVPLTPPPKWPGTYIVLGQLWHELMPLEAQQNGLTAVPLPPRWAVLCLLYFWECESFELINCYHVCSNTSPGLYLSALNCTHYLWMYNHRLLMWTHRLLSNCEGWALLDIPVNIFLFFLEIVQRYPYFFRVWHNLGR